jgi:uncharacterized protein (DUF2267 family)
VEFVRESRRGEGDAGQAALMTIRRWLTPAAAADRLNVYPHELAKLVREGKIPAPSRRLGPKRPRYDLEALDKAMLGEDAQSEADRQRSYDEQVAAVAAELAARPKRVRRGTASESDNADGR